MPDVAADSRGRASGCYRGAVAIRLIAIDIDGTLLDSRWELPARNRAALAEAARRGIEIAIVTGRRYHFARPILDQLPCPITAIVSNGALVRRPDGRTPVRHLLSRETARSVLAATARWRDSAGLVFDRPGEGQVVFERIDWDHPSRRAYAERNRPFIREVSPLDAAIDEDPLQVMFNGPLASMRDLAGVLRTSAGTAHCSITATEYASRDFALIDVLAPGCTKGSTLADWAARQGYHRDEVMAIGDNVNDIEMLEVSGRPVVMANAVPELLERGWAITASNDEAGVAEAIERWTR
ncbi:MAG: HAD-IIB family hydrolase [Acidobacteria bacterium]|jgi:Cof subfamily protein (haloacid dehalogenase superfamily)|nr:HAD-IIB family hydrolase [Acidobacteriota bacterium]